MEVTEAGMGKLRAMLYRRKNSTEDLVFHRISKGKVPTEVIYIEKEFIFSFYLWPRFLMISAFFHHTPQVLLFRPI